ncbi:ATP-binding protein [Sporolactobacillus putidus]|uniref:ATP-binding protein n=1 Tax=Sporolactobacillus putidus TaxID=492735 RepID=UPI001E45F028|nr:ATP-binding protein [Sporolactobacillus putidus]
MNTEKSKVIVDSIDSYSWASGQPIQKGDIVQLIDGYPARYKLSVQNGHFIDHADTITIIRKNQSHQYIINGSQSVSEIFYAFLVPVPSFLICFLMACYMYKYHRKNTAVPVLILFLAVTGPILLNISANFRVYNWIRYVITLSMCFSLVLFLHFLKEYFTLWSLTFITKHILSILYIGAFFVFINRVWHAAYPFELIYVSIVFILIVFLIFRLYIKTIGLEIHRSVQVLLFGTFLALFPFVALYALPRLFFNESIMLWEWTTPFLIFLPVTLTYLVLSSSLIDVSFVISRLAYYSLLSLFLTVISLSGSILLLPDLAVKGLLSLIRVGLFIFMSVLIFCYAKEYIDYRLRKQLYPKRQDFQASLNRFMQWMKPQYKLSDLAFILKREVENCLPVEEVTLAKVESERQTVSLIDNKVIHVSDDHSWPKPDHIGSLRSNTFGFSVLLSQNKNECVALIGKWKKPRRQLNIDEKIWFETLINYAQIIIENLYRAEELVGLLSQSEERRDTLPQTVQRALFRMSERERKQLSNDLHDTTVQDQLALAREIDAEKTRWSDLSVIGLLNRIRERILNNVDTLRQVIHELRPEFIHQMGLGESLKELLHQVKQRASFSLHAYIDQDLRVYDSDLELNLYRVVQELMNNAMKHSQANQVTLIVSQKSDHYLLLYDDDGIGLKKNPISPSFGTMGLSGLIGRVESTGGTITMDTINEDHFKKGLHIEIIWPIRQS